MGTENLIVVGVDGSGPSRAALDFALDEAVRRSAQVRVVAAYHPPDYWPVAYGMAAGMILPPTDRELYDLAEQAARQTLDAAVAAAGAAATVPVELRVVPGNAAKVLLDQAAGADLLVVGHRGLGGFTSACLGSVGLQCVLHAVCPVVVVRPPGTRPTAAASPETAASASR